jgi:hypothetical protein
MQMLGGAEVSLAEFLPRKIEARTKVPSESNLMVVSN